MAMAISFAKAGASQIAIGARSKLEEVADEMKQAAKSVGKPEPEVLGLKLDIADQKSVEKAAASVAKKFGKVDVVVNNAGIVAPYAKITEGDPDEWWNVIHVNFRGPYLIARSFIPLLLKSELKTLITVSSVGTFITTPTLSSYQISKTAATRLMDFAAAGYKDEGLVAFCVHPGNILTDIMNKGEGMDPKLKAVFTETPNLCGDTLVYLTHEKRDWLSGRYVNCTWDMPEFTSSRKQKEIVEKDLLKITLRV
jgi:NAD(P)-dependent dehydrogenase (short-subunit alcohol dehydrogenase family)